MALCQMPAGGRKISVRPFIGIGKSNSSSSETFWTVLRWLAVWTTASEDRQCRGARPLASTHLSESKQTAHARLSRRYRRQGAIMI